MIRLGVNLDHVATLRQARGERVPDVLAAGHAAMIGGADQIVVHLREDRRHVQDRDVRLLRDALPLPLALEMAATAEMVRFALEVRPDAVCLVPERRDEKTTEGGLDLSKDAGPIERAVAEIQKAGIPVSLFVDPDEASVVAASGVEAQAVELHTGRYANAKAEAERIHEYLTLARGAVAAKSLGMRVHAGHGLDYANVARIAALPDVEELNIGFAIVARAVFSGLERAVWEMRDRMVRAKAEDGGAS